MGRYGISLTAEQRRILGISYGRYKDCGSNAGWMFHRRAHEDPCGDCERAHLAWALERCGSYSGWMLHRRMGTEVCTGCGAARDDYVAARRVNSASQSDLCGTNDGWKRHRQNQTPVCPPCEAALDLFCTAAKDRRTERRTAWARAQVKDCTMRPGAVELAEHLMRSGWNRKRAFAHAQTAFDVLAPHIRRAAEREGEGT